MMRGPARGRRCPFLPAPAREEASDGPIRAPRLRAVGEAAIERLDRSTVNGFWIHVNADVFHLP